MKKIYLHGKLHEDFGHLHEFNVSTPRFALSALCSQIEGFKEVFSAGNFIVLFGDKEKYFSLDEEELMMQFGNETELHIIPYIGGAGGRGGGVAQTIYGALKVIGGIVVSLVPGGQAAGLFLIASGAGMIASGIRQISVSKPQVTPDTYENREDPDQRPSFLFSGPTNTTQQGLPVPLIYGRIRVGSEVISSGLTTEVIS